MLLFNGFDDDSPKKPWEKLHYTKGDTRFRRDKGEMRVEFQINMGVIMGVSLLRSLLKLATALSFLLISMLSRRNYRY